MANWGGDGNWFQKLVQSFIQGRNNVNQDLINTGLPAQFGRAIGSDLYNFTQSPIGRGIGSIANSLTAPTDQRGIQERILRGLIQGGEIFNPGGLNTFTNPGRGPGLQRPIRPAVSPLAPLIKPVARTVAKKASATARVAARVTKAPRTAPVVKPKATRLTQRY